MADLLDEEAQKKEGQGKGRQAGASILTDLAKRAFYTGVGALFLTEESIKSLVGELKLPKEVASQLLQNAQKSKSDLYIAIANEIKKVFERFDFTELIKQFLRDHECEVQATIRFKPLEKKK